MRLLISGGRHFDDAAAILGELNRIHAEYPITVLIHGGLPTIGSVAEDWARQNDVHIIRYPANWSLLGKQADTKRNLFMLGDSRPDALLAFPGGRHVHELVQQAQERHIPVVTARIVQLPSEEEYFSDSPEGDSLCQSICAEIISLAKLDIRPVFVRSMLP
ncbi:DUF2493 domain-containing protein (plasmid) [Phyllobacterium sp. 628]|uniref:DUF2493 domain-containing protein n=1 Tax=Phyllobacterium sp. 628 TaxID=2718938 RepID=UPI0016621F0D|nr:DUF2493 domain-containing protein [Phyllobacterium sp. 628]QND50458.1 DUF2493 domain-containing protein [Phyllobacterium sp. 628]